MGLQVPPQGLFMWGGGGGGMHWGRVVLMDSEFSEKWLQKYNAQPYFQPHYH